MSNSKTSLEDRMSFIEEALTLLLKKETAGVVASAAAPVAKAKAEPSTFGPEDHTIVIIPKGHVMNNGAALKSPQLSVGHTIVGSFRAKWLGVGELRAIQYFINNPKAWAKAMKVAKDGGMDI